MRKKCFPKMFPVIALLFCLLFAHSDAFSMDLSDVWNAYQDLYLKNYATSEVRNKIATFYDASTRVVKHNIEFDLKMHSFWIGLNQWSHMNKSELQKTLACVDAGNSDNVSEGLHFNSTTFDPPDSLDYRHLNMVTPAGYQGGCGCCYAFATLASLEGVWAKKNNKSVVALSEQNVIDCSQKDGCTGKTLESVYNYVKRNHGIDTNESYPYEAKVGSCRFKKENIGATCNGYIGLPLDEQAILKTVAETGPAAIILHGTEQNFSDYSGGIFEADNCNKPMDHAVAIVGYGTDKKSKKPYWILKNSWGYTWGVNGFMKIVRNKDMCRIAHHGTVPIL